MASWTMLAPVETMTSTKCFRIKSTIIVRMPAGITAPESARKTVQSWSLSMFSYTSHALASLPAPNEPEFLNFVINWLTVRVSSILMCSTGVLR